MFLRSSLNVLQRDDFLLLFYNFLVLFRRPFLLFQGYRLAIIRYSNVVDLTREENLAVNIGVIALLCILRGDLRINERSFLLRFVRATLYSCLETYHGRSLRFYIERGNNASIATVRRSTLIFTRLLLLNCRYLSCR